MTTTGPDVRQLGEQNLPQGVFPGGGRQPFRIFFAPEIHARIWQHAGENKGVEICGVLVGKWGKDADGPFVAVTETVRGEAATNKFAEVTFTHETWARINQEMDTKFSHLTIVGWYHSHPDFGIFLSDRDLFIHQHFFSGPGQVAYVIDPVRDLEGVFAWRHGKAAPLSHFWAGDEIRTVRASHEPPSHRLSSDLHERDRLDAPAALAPSSAMGSALPTALTLLAWICLFLLGYLYAGFRSRWEKEMIVQGAVAHYGLTKVLGYGLEKKLAN